MTRKPKLGSRSERRASLLVRCPLTYRVGHHDVTCSALLWRTNLEKILEHLIEHGIPPERHGEMLLSFKKAQQEWQGLSPYIDDEDDEDEEDYDDLESDDL